MIRKKWTVIETDTIWWYVWYKEYLNENGNLDTYLRSKDIEVASPIGAADELAFVLGRDAWIFGNPNHRGTQPVGVQVQAIEGFTLLFAEALTWIFKHKLRVDSSTVNNNMFLQLSDGYVLFLSATWWPPPSWEFPWTATQCKLSTWNPLQTFYLLYLSWNTEGKGHTWPFNWSVVNCPITSESLKMRD